MRTEPQSSTKVSILPLDLNCEGALPTKPMNPKKSINFDLLAWVAMTTDRIIQAWSARRKQVLGL